MATPDEGRWATIKERAADALELPLEERHAFLERACPDVGLRTEVESLVRSAERATTFLEEPPLDLLASCSECDDATENLVPGLQEALGDRYTIERELGRGGMATVFLARDERHSRRVALKLVAPHVAALDSISSGRNRFQRRSASRHG